VSDKPLRVLVAGLGNMGRSHALAYHANPGFAVEALVNRSGTVPPGPLEAYRLYRSFEDALRETRPDVASINTYSDSHADYAVAAFEAGCDVFVEKPLALNEEQLVAVERAAETSTGVRNPVKELAAVARVRQHPGVGRLRRRLPVRHPHRAGRLVEAEGRINGDRAHAPPRRSPATPAPCVAHPPGRHR